LVLHHKGDLDAAETALSRALAISRRLNDQEGIARDLGNLSLVPETRGDLDRAEALCRESLAIAQRIGAHHISATKYANLGDMALARGRIAEARDLWTNAVALFKQLGDTKHHAEFSQKLNQLPGATTYPVARPCSDGRGPHV
jgi:tetratricopeptide (TPR) repeat protein